MTSYTIEQHVQMIKLYYKNDCSLVQTLRALRPFYGRRGGPSKSTIQRLVAKFQTTGSVNNQPALVRRRNARSGDNIAAVRESVQENPGLSIPRRAQELGLSQSSVWRILRQDLGLLEDTAAPAVLYYNPLSAPCISVLLLAKQIGYKLNLKLINVQEKEQLKPEFIKMNPQHTIPTLDDNGFIISESRTIMRYLVDQYAKDDTLYPKDPKMRAVVDQRLDFELGTLSQRFAQYFYPALSGCSLDKEKLSELDKAMEILNVFLEGKDWVAGDKMSIADLSLLSLISIMQIAKYDVTKYKNVQHWLNCAKSAAIGYEEMEQKGFSEMSKFVSGILAKLGIS